MRQKTLFRRRFKRLLAAGVATASLVGGSLALTAAPVQATSGNVGYACGYRSNVSLFGSPYGSMGCAPQTYEYASPNSLSPSSTLTSGAYDEVIDSDGASAIYGPAYMFSSPYDANDNLSNSGQIRVWTYGTDTVYAQAKAEAVGPTPFWTKTPTSWQPAGDVGYVEATCIATSSTSQSTYVTVHNGIVDTSIGPDGYPATQDVVPENPPVNHTVPFTIDNVGDHGVMVFNEVINNPDGSVTVNGAHMYLQGPSALGDVIIAQAMCGSGSGGPTTS